MRILIFYQYFTTPKGSWGTRVYEFARRWVDAGDQVTVVTSVYDKSDLQPTGLVDRIDVDGIDVRIINIRLSNKDGFGRRVLTFLGYAALASGYALTLPADVVLASSGPITVGIPGLVARYLRHTPLVFEVRDLWPEGAIQLGILKNPVLIRVARLLEQACYRAASEVVTLSEGAARWITARDGHSHLSVVPNASDNELFGRADTIGAGPKFRVLYTGTLGAMDDCGQIINMAEVLARRGIDDIETIIIGDGKERAHLEAETRRLGLRNVSFLGLMPKDVLARWLVSGACSLMVCKDLPAQDACSPNKMFDSFAAGVPVIQTTQGWIKELLERERCGLTVRAGDAEGMADAVQRLVREPILHAEMASNARRVAHSLFDRDLLAARMREVLQQAADGEVR